MRRAVAVAAVAAVLVLLATGCGGEPDRGGAAPAATPPPGAPDPGSPLLEGVLAAAVPRQPDLALPPGWAWEGGPDAELLPAVAPPDPCGAVQQSPFAAAGGYDAERSGRLRATDGARELALVGSAWHYPDAAVAERALEALAGRAVACDDPGALGEGVLTTYDGSTRPRRTTLLYGWESTSTREPAESVRSADYAYVLRGSTLLRYGVVTTGAADLVDLAPVLRRTVARAAGPALRLADEESGTTGA